MNDRFQRIELIVKTSGLKKLEKSKIMICGIGAVGGSVTYTLARSGIYNFILVDFDSVDITNINRQFVAFDSTIGKNKTEVMKQIILDINPKAKVEISNIKITSENATELLKRYKPDFLIDAIDDTMGKIALIESAKNLGIEIISSMGAALKTDLTKIKIGTLNSATTCPLARSVRKKLKDKGIDYSDVKCVYSSEIINQEIQETKNETKILPSFMPITTAFGLHIADYIIKRILEK